VLAPTVRASQVLRESALVAAATLIVELSNTPHHSLAHRVCAARQAATKAANGAVRRMLI
jgi:hypothetical protein